MTSAGAPAAKVYRNAQRRQEWLGIEPLDAVGLGGLLWLLELVNSDGLALNALCVALAYTAFRILKRGKPQGYTRALARFYLVKRPHFSAATPDSKQSVAETTHQGGLSWKN
jgi:hypothetical protein